MHKSSFELSRTGAGSSGGKLIKQMFQSFFGLR